MTTASTPTARPAGHDRGEGAGSPGSARRVPRRRRRSTGADHQCTGHRAACRGRRVRRTTVAAGTSAFCSSPASVGAPAGFMGIRLRPGERITEHCHPYSRGVPLRGRGARSPWTSTTSRLAGRRKQLSIPSGCGTAASTPATAGLFVFTCGPLAPARNSATSTPNCADPSGRGERPGAHGSSSPASGWSHPAASAGRFWKTAHRGAHRHPADHLLRPVGFRSQIAAECDFDPVAAGLTAAGELPQRPVHAVRPGLRRARRSPTPAWSSPTPSADRTGVVLGSAVGATMRAGERVRHGQRRTAASGWSTPRVRQPVPLPRARPQQPGHRDRVPATGARAGAGHLDRLHVRHRRRSGTATN